MMQEKGKRYLVSTGIYAYLEDLPLVVDEKYLYRFLVANHFMTVAGLYELRRAQMIGSTGIGKDRLEQCLLRLVGTDLIRYDSNLMWVPRIPDEQNIEQKTGWRRQLLRLRSTYAEHPSDLPGARNQAYVAFLDHHAARFQYIDLYGDADDWNHERTRQTAHKTMLAGQSSSPEGEARPGANKRPASPPDSPDDVFNHGLQRGNEEATMQQGAAGVSGDMASPAAAQRPKATRKHGPAKGKSPPS